MIHRPTEGVTRHELADIMGGYRAQRARVDHAYRLLREVESGRHTPAAARAASQELTAAVREATTTVTRALQLAAPTGPVARRRPSRAPRGREATRLTSRQSAAWSAELLRLAQLGVWLRRTTLDDFGARIPTAVRVGCRAASGPHIAGMVAEPDDLVAATLHEPWIGVDLRTVVDGYGTAPAHEPTAPEAPPATAASREA